MERTLGLVLDKDTNIYLELCTLDSVKMDEYTTKNFEDSEQIREKYKKQIETFLKQHEERLKNINPNLKRGRIVLLQKNGNELKEVKILYKKHLIAFKHIVKDRLTMQEFSRNEKIGYYNYGLKRLVSLQIHREISYSGTFSKPSRLKYIEHELKKDKNSYYEIVRIMVKAYKNQRLTRPYLKTMEQIYKEYKLQKEEQKLKRTELNVVTPISESLNPTEINIDENKIYNVDGFIYSTEERELFDLDDLQGVEETNFDLDGLGTNGKNLK